MLKKQIIFLSFYDKNYSRSAVLLNSNSAMFERIYYKLSHSSISMLLQLRRILNLHRGKIAAVVVMSPSHKIIPIIRIFCRYPLILDAGWPLIDGSKSRRGTEFRWKVTSIISYTKILVIDFLSFALSDLVLVETNEQRKRVSQKFLFKHSKVKVSFTGFNEVGQGLILKSPAGQATEEENEIKKRTRILFRGKINQESGFSNIVKAFKMLDDNFEIVYVVNRIPKNHQNHPNESFITSYVDRDLTTIYADADICIGQVSSHQRLEVTIPHKAFEAAFFSKVYISAKNSAIKEFASDSEVFFLDVPNPESLSNAIIEIAADRELSKRLAINFNRKYHQVASQKLLGNQLDIWVKTLCQPDLDNI